MYFLYSLGGVTFNKCWITLSILNWYSPNFQGFILMKNALNNQVGMLGDMFLWLVANLKQGVICFIKQGGGNHKIAWVYILKHSFLKISHDRLLLGNQMNSSCRELYKICMPVAGSSFAFQNSYGSCSWGQSYVIKFPP